MDFKKMTKDEIQNWTLKVLGEAWILEPKQRAKVAKEVMNKLNNEVDPILVKNIMQTRGWDCYNRHR